MRNQGATQHSFYSLNRLNEALRIVALQRDQRLLIIKIISFSLFIILLLLLHTILKKRRLESSHKKLFHRTNEILQSEAKERAQRKHYEKLISGYQQQLDQISSGIKKSDTEIKKAGIVIDSTDMRILTDRIRDIMENSTEIFSPDFSIERLAILTQSKSRYISHVINEAFGMNFNSLLADYRVKEACKRLCDFDRFKNYTIEAITESIGYRSRTTFISVFKKNTGLTPSEYARIARSEQKV